MRNLAGHIIANGLGGEAIDIPPKPLKLLFETHVSIDGMNMSNKITANDNTCHDKRQRLLEAAGEIFAEQGYRCATIRDICNRAGANIAAVNYHFGDKEHLYAEALKYAFENSRQKYPSDGGLGPDASPQQQLRAFIHALVHRILDEERTAWQGKLIPREMIEPTQALQTLAQEAIRPEFERLHQIVRRLLGSDATEEQVLQCVWSVTGQCLFHLHARHIIATLRPQGAYSAADKEQIAEHITRFSMAAMRCIAGQSDK